MKEPYYPYRIEHAGHTAGGQKGVDGGKSAVDGRGTETAHHSTLEEDYRRRDRSRCCRIGYSADLGEHQGLEDDGKDDGEHRRGEEDDDGGQLLIYHRTGGHGYEEEPRTEVEFRRQGRGERRRVYRCRRGREESCREEDEQCDGERRYRRDGHIFNMCEEGSAAERGGQDGGVGEWRHLIAEICAGEYGSRRPPVAEAFGLADAHQSHADGGHGGPRATGHYRDDGADEAARDEEYVGVDDLHAVVDEHGHDAADHPRARQQSDEQEDDNGRAYAADGMVDFGLEGLPRLMKEEDGYENGDARRDDEHQLTGPRQCVDAVNADDHCQEDYQKGHRRDGEDVFTNILHTC